MIDSVRNRSAMPLAIIGMGCRFPGADDLRAFWRLLVEGRSAIDVLPPDRFDQELYYDPQPGTRFKSYSRLAAVLSHRRFDRESCPIPASLEKTADIAHLLMCQVAAAALRDAGLDPFQLPLRNTGVYVGHCQGSTLAGDYVFGTCVAEAVQLVRECDDFRSLSPDVQQAVLREVVDQTRAALPGRNLPRTDCATSMIAGIVSKAFNLSGPFLAVNSACASSLQALLQAARALQLGRIEMAIVGGASDCKADTLMVFSVARSLSATGSRPFDADADGLVCGEGYGAIVLKTLDRALADGDRIRAVIRGIGVSSDGSGRSLWAPRKEGQIEAMRRAYGQELDLSELQYVEAHATATQRGDATELMALDEVLQGRLPPGKKIPITSVKANIGHSLEAAGMAGIIKAVLAMEHGTIPPAINIRKLNTFIDWDKVPFYVPQQATAWPAPASGGPRRAGVNAFGIGGLNLHVVIDQFAAPAPTSAPPAMRHPAVPRDVESDEFAVIGMGCILPGARDVDNYWELLRTSASAISSAPPDRWRTDLGYKPGVREPYYSPVTRGGYVTDFNYDWRARRIPPLQIQRADPLQFMLLEATEQALKDAGYDQRPLERMRAGVLVGTEFGGDFSVQLQLALRVPNMGRTLRDALARRGVSPDTIDRIEARFGDALLRHWPALIDETGSFSSSALASRISKTWDLMGGATAIDCGGNSSLATLATAMDLLAAGDCDLVICAAGQRRMSLPFQEGMALAGRLATDNEPAPPLDSQAAGILLGEGVGVVVLKRLADARRDGDPIRAIVRGAAAAHASSFSAGLRLAIDRALQIADANPAEVALLETDSFGSPAVDSDIVQTLAAAYRGQPGVPPAELGAVVGQIGYLGGASGMASLIKAALEVDHREMPAMPGIQQPLPALAACSNALRAAVHREPLTHVTEDGRLLAAVTSFDRGLSFHVVLERGARLAASERPPANNAPVEIHRMREQPIPAANQTNAVRPRLVFMFPGQGSQYAGMLRQLVAELPAAADAMRRIDATAARHGLPGFAQLAWEDTGLLGHDVFATQAAMLMADTILLAAVQDFGIQPDVVAGHSYGEYAALIAAGAWDFEQALLATKARCDAIRAARSTRGAMLAIGAAAGAVERLIARLPEPVYIANYNAPEQVVVGGRPEAIEQLAALAQSEKLPARLLAVPSAFHTPLLESAADRLRQALARVDFQRPRVPMQSGITLRLLSEPDEIRDHLVRHMTHPVRHAELVCQLSAGGETILLEVGPQQILTRLHRRIPVAPGTTSIATDDPQRSGLAHLEPVIDQLKRVFLLHEPPASNGQPHVQPEKRPAEHSPPQQLLSFDATARRRENMRRTAAGQTAKPSPVPAKATAPAPKPAAQPAKAAPAAALESRGSRVASLPPVPRSPGGGAKIEPAKTSANGLHASPAAPIPPAPAVAPVPAASAKTAALEEFLVNFVVEHTGYPPEIVELDTDLEADLGIDSIRKAQLFGELQPYFDVKPAAGLTLDQFATLRHVVRFLENVPIRGSLPGLQVREPAGSTVPAAVSPAAAAAPPASVAAPAAAPVLTAPSKTAALEHFLVNFVVEHTGYPPELVELDTDLEADLGIDSIRKAQLFAELQPYFDVKPAAGLTLDQFATLRHVVRFLENVPIRGQLPGMEEFESGNNGHAAVLASTPPSIKSSDAATNGAAHPAASSPHKVPEPARPQQKPILDAACVPAGMQLLRLSGTPYAVGQQQGQQLQQTLRGLLQCLVDLPDRVRQELQLPAGQHDPCAAFTANELQQLEGIAETADVPLEIVAALNVALLDIMQRAGLPATFEPGPHAAAAIQQCAASAAASWSAWPALRKHLVPVVQLCEGDGAAWLTLSLAGAIFRPPLQQSPHKTAPDQSPAKRPAVCERYALRMLDVPLDPDQVTTNWCRGPALVFGSNPTADALLRRLQAEGVVVHHLPSTGDSSAALAAFDVAWQQGPIYHLFLTSARDDEPASRLDADTWRRLRDRVAVVPFMLCQRWMQRARAAGMLDQGTVAATTRLGGDFGFSGRVLAPEGGALTGLMKALHLEYRELGGHRQMVFKAVDAPDSEPPDQLADLICRELAAGTIDYEVAFVGGIRRLQNAFAEAPAPPADPGIRPGSAWVVTGGARGITARCALALGRKFGLKLHLIGNTSLAGLDASWKDLSAQALAGLKESVMREARHRGQTPNEAWQKIEKLLEIDRSLRAFESAGVQAVYHVCDVGDRDALARVLDEIRRADGPIEGILHGAGFDRACGFEKKTLDNVLATFGSKADGACHLLALTWNDPLRHFIGFGSISGRLGSNGQADYCMANDMLCKLISAYRTQRPGCRAVGFHWHPWDDVGMAARPENKTAIRLEGIELMPADEGIDHLLAELSAGVSRSEVMITQSSYHARFYGPPADDDAQDAAKADSAQAGAAPQHPLIRSLAPSEDLDGWRADIWFDPAADPFLREHRLGDKPFLPGAVGLEILAEAAALCGHGRVTALRDVEIVEGLVLASGPAAATVTVVPVSGGFAAELSSELRDRQGRLVKAQRVHIRGTVETGQPQAIAERPCGQPPLGWFPNAYPDNGVIYHGPALQCLKDCAFQYDGGWGRIVAPDLSELAGSRGAAGWILPPAVLDACLYACAGFVYLQFGGRVEIPQGFDRLVVGRQPRAGEVCVVRLYFRGHDDGHSRFDFILYGEDGQPILEAVGYRTVLVGSAGALDWTVPAEA